MSALQALAEQAEQEGVRPTTLRALIEEASEAGAARALARIGLDDAKAGRDVGELRELLQAWRDAKTGAAKEIVAWVVRIGLALLVLGMAVRVGVLERLS